MISEKLERRTNRPGVKNKYNFRTIAYNLCFVLSESFFMLCIVGTHVSVAHYCCYSLHREGFFCGLRTTPSIPSFQPMHYGIFCCIKTCTAIGNVIPHCLLFVNQQNPFMRGFMFTVVFLYSLAHQLCIHWLQYENILLLLMSKHYMRYKFH